MSDNSAIEWTDATWNPVTGCTEVSPGCDNCYAKAFSERFRGVAGHHFEQGFDVVLRPERLDQPLSWRKPRRVFVNSMSDLFHNAITDQFITEVFARMWWAPHHTFQVLTKRHSRMRSLLPRIEEWLRLREEDLALVDCPTPLTWPLPNVWLGVSVENQRWADIRVPALLDTPAAVRWLSCEPLLGPIDLHAVPGLDGQYGHAGRHNGIGTPECPRISHHHHDERCRFPLDWVVVGGESGPGARPMHPDWARGIRDACVAASVPFFFKQWGEYVAPDQMPEDTFMSWDVVNGTSAYDRTAPWRMGKKRAGRLLDGRTWDEYPSGEAGERSDETTSVDLPEVTG